MAEFVKTKNGRYIADWLFNRYGATTFFPQEEFLSFEEAREFVRKLNLKNQKEWQRYSKSGKRPIDIPGRPSKVYKGKGWKNLHDFLGTKK